MTRHRFSIYGRWIKSLQGLFGFFPLGPSAVWSRWLPLVVIAYLLRMYLVGRDGILPLVADSTNYAEIAANVFSNSPFTRLSPQRPGLGLLAWLGAQFGMPYKLLIDLLIGMVALLAGLTMEKLTRSFSTAGLTFLMILFNPWFMAQSQFLLTEPLVCLLLLLVLLFAVWSLGSPHERRSGWALLGASGVTSIYLLSRNETPLIIFFHAVIGFIILIRYWRLPSDQFAWRRLILRIAVSLLPLVIALSSVQMIKYWHGSRYGSTAASLTEQPGFKSLVNVLYSIPPEQEIRYAPVTRQTLALACDVSPTLNHHRSKLLNTKSSSYGYAARILGLQDEVGTWLNWHLIGNIWGEGRSPDQEMMAAANEIRAAQTEGRLDRRRAMYPISPLWKVWLPELPEKVWQAVVRSVNLNPNIVEPKANFPVQSSVDQGWFDDGLLSRSGVGPQSELRVYGNKYAPSDRATAIQIQTRADEPVVKVPIYENNSGQAVFSLRLDELESRDVLDPLQIRLVDDSTATPTKSSAQKIEFKHRRNNLKFQWDSETDGTQSTLEQWVVINDRPAVPSNSRMWLKRKIATFYRWQILATLLVSMIAGYGRCQDNVLRSNIAWALFAGLSLWLARCVFYSLIEVWLKWGLPRYVEPNILLTLFVAVSAAFLLGALIGKRFSSEVS